MPLAVFQVAPAPFDPETPGDSRGGIINWIRLGKDITMAISKEHEALFAEARQKGALVYEEKLKPLLESSHNGRAVAIHVDTGDYSVADTMIQARRLVHERHPEGMIFARVIGVEPMNGQILRLMSGSKS
jgi:hypothetical protein